MGEPLAEGRAGRVVLGEQLRLDLVQRDGEGPVGVAVVAGPVRVSGPAAGAPAIEAHGSTFAGCPVPGQVARRRASSPVPVAKVSHRSC